MPLSSADLREIKSTIISTFSDRFLQDIAERVASIVGKKFEQQLNAQNEVINSLEVKISQLQSDKHSLEAKIDSQEQTSRNLNLRIFNMHAADDKDLNSEVQKLFSITLKADTKPSDIERCHRISPKIPSDKPPAVLVRFTNESARLSVLKMRKFLKDSNVYIKEDLTKVRLALFQTAVREFSSKSAWVLNGNVYVKVDNKVHRISCESELFELKNK